MPRSFLRNLILILSCGSAACVLAQTGSWLDVPYVKQQKDGCGAAVISMVIQYWRHQQGIPASPEAAPETILNALYSPSSHGIYASAMERYFQQNGFRTFAFPGQWDDFARELAKGRPLIAALKPDASGSLHYVVVAGVDTRQQLVLLNDPARRKLLQEDRATFERDWKATHNWTLLVVPQPATQ
jgi:ABC-type bacteriocin/lantibiotic exporter with double-glycine peptidase domain